MSPSTPPILPITTSQTTTTTTTTPTTTTEPSQPPIATTAFRSYLTRLHDQINDGLSHRRPWSELLDRSAFSKPESLSDATTRIRKNYSYFRVNYFATVTAIVAISLLTNPFSLLTLALLLAAWSFLYLFKPSDQPLVLFGRSFSDKETLAILVISSVFVVFLTNVGSVLMSAIVVGVALVCAHGAFRVPEDLFLDDQESGSVSTGFLTFLGATTKNGATATSSGI